MHQTPAFVNAFYACFMALHFRPIFDSRPQKPQKSAISLPQAPPKLLNFSQTHHKPIDESVKQLMRLFGL
jgi:hypothetical protein